MNPSNRKAFTQYPDINEVLTLLTKGIVQTLGENLIGIYLMGSLSYNSFNPDSSDIDLVVILNKPASYDQLVFLQQVHLQVEAEHKKWAKRIECSYVPMGLLPNILPPKTPRPYIGEGIFYKEARYGNEWLINQYLLYEYGIPLHGPEYNTLIKRIDIKDVQNACIKDLFEEWQPKMNDWEWLSNSHYQSYVVLNLCRILYTVFKASIASKAVSAQWVKEELCPEWRPLIEAAEQWQYGKDMNLQKETTQFIQFVIDIVSHKL